MNNHNYIKLNETEYHLALGSFFRIIKEESFAKNSFLQSEFFCDIFDIDSIADSTVNNYVTGFRAINTRYKEKIIRKKHVYDTSDNTIFISTIYNIISLLENKVQVPFSNKKDSINFINSNKKVIAVCHRLYSIAKNDTSIPSDFIEKLTKKLSTNNYYDFLVHVLAFVIIDKKQPIYIEDEIITSIDNSIRDTKISLSDVKEFIDVELHESMWSSLRALSNLTNKDNPFACLQMAFYEFYGLITGKPRYIKSYDYFKIAADKKHPAAIWAIGFMYYRGYIGQDYRKAFRYFHKAMKFGSSAALNSIGLIYLNGNVPHISKNEDKAIEFFKLAIERDNIFAYNNLGLIYEKKGDFENAFNLYLQASNKNESWASNRLGEFYRTGKFVKKDMKKAFFYYNKSNEDAMFEISAWAKYNLAVYFYKNGNPEASVEKDLDKAIGLLTESSEVLTEAREELKKII